MDGHANAGSVEKELKTACCIQQHPNICLQSTHLVQEGAHAKAGAAQQEAASTHTHKDKMDSNKHYTIYTVQGNFVEIECIIDIFLSKCNERQVPAWMHLWKE